MTRHIGKCPECGKIHSSNQQNDIVICECYQRCPICGANMTPYQPDLAANTYALDRRRDLAVLMVCTLHLPNFFSTQKPVEVVCT